MIAEGLGRHTGKQLMQFLSIAKGSLYELETQILLSNSHGMIKEDSVEITKNGKN